MSPTVPLITFAVVNVFFSSPGGNVAFTRLFSVKEIVHMLRMRTNLTRTFVHISYLHMH